MQVEAVSHLVVNGHTIQVSAERDPAGPALGQVWAAMWWWRAPACSAMRRERASTSTAGARKKVVISAPAKGDITTVVLGVNDDHEVTAEETIMSNASCTTKLPWPQWPRCSNDSFGLVTRGYITTIHAYTSDQRIQDAPHSDLRRARAAAMSMIPTTTGAAVAVGLGAPRAQGQAGRRGRARPHADRVR